MNSTKSFLKPKNKKDSVTHLLPDLLSKHPRRSDESLRDYSKRMVVEAHDTMIELFGFAYTENSLRTKIIKQRLSPEKRDKEQYPSGNISTDKEEKELNWRTLFDATETWKKAVKQHSKSQDDAVWSVKTNKPICVVVLSDTHIGSWGTDHDLVKTIIDEIVNTPNLYVILAGDLTQMAIKMRSVAEVSDNILPPKWQYKVLESIMKEIKHKVIAACWENHASEREEKQIGFSPTAMMLEDNVIYFSGIGHLTMVVGKQEYKVGVSHVFRGRSMYNGVHGQMKYMRMEAPQLDVCVAGDSHVPALAHFVEGGKEKIAINGGSTQLNSSYAKRYFSLKTFPVFPCFTLDPKTHSMTAFWSVKNWLKAKS